MHRVGCGGGYLLCTNLVRWAAENQLPIPSQKSSVTLFTSSIPMVLDPPTSSNRWRGGSAEQNPQNPVHHAEYPLHLRPPRLQLCRASRESPQCHECLSWVEQGLHEWNLAWLPYTKPFCVPSWTLSPPSGSPNCVFDTPWQTWGDPEQDSGDRDRLPSKGRSIPSESRSSPWGCT